MRLPPPSAALRQTPPNALAEIGWNYVEIQQDPRVSESDAEQQSPDYCLMDGVTLTVNQEATFAASFRVFGPEPTVTPAFGADTPGPSSSGALLPTLTVSSFRSGLQNADGGGCTAGERSPISDEPALYYLLQHKRIEDDVNLLSYAITRRGG